MSKVLETYVTKRSRQKTIMYLTSMHAYSSLRLYWLAIMTRLTSSAIPGSIADAEGNQDARIQRMAECLSLIDAVSIFIYSFLDHFTALLQSKL